MKPGLVVLFIASLCCVAEAQVADLLDLTIERAATAAEPGELVGGIVAGAPGKVIGGTLPRSDRNRHAGLTMDFVQIAPLTCSWGDQVVYEIRITNIGPSAVLLPWSTDRTAAYGPENQPLDGFREATFALRIKQGDVDQWLASTDSAYGSRGVPGSRRALAPGSSVHIRAAAMCRSAAASGSAPQRAETRMAVATLRLKNAPQAVGTFVVSSPQRLTVTPP